MTDLASCLEEYLQLRRGLGHQMGHAERPLRQFVAHLSERGLDTVTVVDAIEWAGEETLSHPRPPTRATLRLSVVRGFAGWLHALDPRHEIPPTKVFPGLPGRRAPHIYTAEQVSNMLDAASKLSRREGRNCYRVFFGLLTVTGMRVSEAIALSRPDVDFQADVVTVVDSKSRTPRLIPLHPTTAAVLSDFAAGSPIGPLFANPAGGRLAYSSVRYAFNQMRSAAGLSDLEPLPRIHDLRHTFAVNTLLDWSRDGDDIRTRLPLLSTYLGHSNPAHTYWYLTSVPALMSDAAQLLTVNGSPLP